VFRDREGERVSQLTTATGAKSSSSDIESTPKTESSMRESSMVEREKSRSAPQRQIVKSVVQRVCKGGGNTRINCLQSGMEKR